MFYRLLLAACLALPSLSLRHTISPQDVAGCSQEPSLREVFQVYPPPISPMDLLGSTACSFTLMTHDFGNSAGKPFIGMLFQKFLGFSKTHVLLGSYKPLCGPDWDVAVLNLSVLSYGRQFDRLGVRQCLYENH
jgi:Peptide N-acetyl-beta-D-glucosaminyl asparaginase amidase A